MTNVVDINPVKTEMIATLKERIADIESNKISGVVCICEYKESYSLDMPGEFSGDIDSISELIGKLKIVSDYFSSQALDEYFGETYE
jgi:hypothetical protein